MREIGLSDKYFYYTSSGKGATMDIRLVLSFKSAVNRQALIEATSEALKLYPEYSARPVLKGERLYYEPNSQPVALLPLSSRYDFGSDDMNGYLFCFQMDTSDDSKIVFSVYHGLSDWNGLNRFIKAIICRYAIHVKGLCDDYFCEVIRTNAPSYDEWNTPINLNPYDVYGQQGIMPSYKPEINGEIFSPSEEFYGFENPSARHIRLKLSTAQFIKTAKSHNTSFVPLLLYITSNAEREAYNTDKTILTMLPVDLRKVFNTDCIVNFSDSAFLPSSLKEHEAPIEEQCRRFRQMIDLTRKPENYATFLYNKAQTVRDFELSPIVQKAHENTTQTAEILKQVTHGVTYPGIMDMPQGADDLIEDIVMQSPFGVSLVLVTTYHDTMSITSIQRFDSEKLVKAIYAKLNALGLDVEIAENILVEQNVMNLERLRRI